MSSAPSRGPWLWPLAIRSLRGPARPEPRRSIDLGRLADLCDGAAGPSRDIDALIAIAVSPSLRSLVSLEPGVWARPDGSRLTAPRYSSSTAAALTLVPDGHEIGFNPRGGGRIEIHDPDRAVEAGWGRNRHFPLAASAAALRARALLDPDQTMADASGQSSRVGARPIAASEGSRQTG